MVKGYLHLKLEKRYKAALQEFKDTIGDEHVIAQSNVWKPLNCPIIKTEYAKALYSFSINLKECQFEVENAEAAKLLEYSENLQILLKICLVTCMRNGETLCTTLKKKDI